MLTCGSHVGMMRYFEDEARRPSVTPGHLLKQDGVDAQAGGCVGGLAQQPGGQTGKQETPQEAANECRANGLSNETGLGRVGTRCRCPGRPRSSGWRRGRGSWFCTREPSSPGRSAASCSSPGPAAARTPWRPSCKRNGDRDGWPDRLLAELRRTAPPAGGGENKARIKAPQKSKKNQSKHKTTFNRALSVHHPIRAQLQSPRVTNQSLSLVTLPSGSVHTCPGVSRTWTLDLWHLRYNLRPTAKGGHVHGPAYAVHSPQKSQTLEGHDI